MRTLTLFLAVVFLAVAPAWADVSSTATAIQSGPVGGALAVSQAAETAAFEAPAVTLRARRQGRVAGKLALPLDRVPASVTTVEGADLAQQGPAQFSEAINRNVAGALGVQGLVDMTGVRLRGQKEAVFLIDGLRDMSHYAFFSSSALSQADRLEVLRGPAGSLYGAGSTGGVFNIIREAAGDSLAATAESTLTEGGGRQARVDADVPWGLGLKSRVGVALQDGPQWRKAENRRTAANLDLRHESGVGTFTVDADYGDGQYTLDAGVPARNGGWPAGVPIDRRFNTPYDFGKYTYFRGMAGYSKDVMGLFTVSERVAYTPSRAQYWGVTGLTLSGPSTVRRTLLSQKIDFNALQNQLELSTGFRAWGGHKAVLGWEYERSRTALRQPRDPALGPVSLPAMDLLNPVETVDAYPLTYTAQLRQDVDTQGVYANWWWEPAGFVSVMAGGRADICVQGFAQDALDPKNEDGVLATSFTQSRMFQAQSARLGAVIRPLAGHSLYASWSSSFNPPSSQLDAKGRPLEPEYSRQWEVGHRIETADGAWSAQAAWFDLVKDNVIASDASVAGASAYRNMGRLRSRGLEVELDIRPVSRVRLRAAYAYSLARYADTGVFIAAPTYGNLNAGTAVSYNGNAPSLVPAHQANAWLTGQGPWGLGAGFGPRWVSDRFADDANTIALAGYVLWDAGLWLERGPVTYTLGVANVADLQGHIVASYGNQGTQLYAGAPRQMRGGVKVRF